MRTLTLKNRSGFTLIELMIVIAIIGILSGITVQQINTARERARDAHRLEDMHTIEVALRAYIIDHDGIPFATAQPEQGPTGEIDRLSSSSCCGPNDDLGCNNAGFAGVWDKSNFDGLADGYPFIVFLAKEGYLSKVPVDPVNDRRNGDNCAHGSAHTYVFLGKPQGYQGCPASMGRFFLLGISDMESREGVWPGSPNFTCGTMQYNQYYEWFTAIPEHG